MLWALAQGAVWDKRGSEVLGTRIRGECSSPPGFDVDPLHRALSGTRTKDSGSWCTEVTSPPAALRTS